jgi:hypothetical protein
VFSTLKIRSNFAWDGLKICKPPFNSPMPLGNDGDNAVLTDSGYVWYVYAHALGTLDLFKTWGNWIYHVEGNREMRRGLQTHA